MFKKIPIWNFRDNTESDLWINPGQIVFATVGDYSGTAIVNINTTTKQLIFKGTPAQLAALLV